MVIALSSADGKVSLIKGRRGETAF